MSESLETLLEPYRGKPLLLIPALHAVHRHFGYLLAEALVAVARGLRLPLSQVYGVATFYAQFSLQPRGKHVVRVCLGTACHVRGAPQVLEELHRWTKEREDGLGQDREVAVESVRCLEACALVPVVVGVDGRYYGGDDPDQSEGASAGNPGRKKRHASRILRSSSLSRSGSSVLALFIAHASPSVGARAVGPSVVRNWPRSYVKRLTAATLPEKSRSS